MALLLEQALYLKISADKVAKEKKDKERSVSHHNQAM
jgi:hypothetical protein